MLRVHNTLPQSQIPFFSKKIPRYANVFFNFIPASQGYLDTTKLFYREIHE